MNIAETTPTKKTIKDLINHEIIEKSATAAPGFFLIAAWMCYTSFEYQGIHQNVQFYLSVTLMILAIFRFLSYLVVKKNIFHVNQVVTLVKNSVLVNAMCWSWLFCNALVAVDYNSHTTILRVSCFCIGISVASVLTIAYSLQLAWAFQWIVLGGPIILGIWYSTHDNHYAQETTVLMSMAVLYLIKQTLDFHKQFRRRIEGQIDLEQTNTLLKESKESLIIETSKRQEAARLASLGEMVSGVAHEINNPLTVIVACFHRGQRMSQQSSTKPEEFGPIFEKIGKTAERISNIIQAMRSLSRDGSGDAFHTVSTELIFKNLDAICSQRFRMKAIELSFPTEHFFIECRQVQIEQILLNLLNNSFDAVCDDENSWVRVTSRIVPGQKLSISVTDSGQGIDINTQQKIMQPFFTTKEVGKGTGLGLSISANIAKAHHGSLEYNVHSEHTQFVLTLPLAQPSQENIKKSA